VFLPSESPHFLKEGLSKELYQQSIREAEKDVEQDIQEIEIEPWCAYALPFFHINFILFL